MAAQHPPLVIGPRQSLSVRRYRVQDSRRVMLLTAIALLLSLICGLMLLNSLHWKLPVTIGAGIFGIVLVWRWPRLALFGMTAGAAAIETFRLGFPDSLTDKVPFFQSLVSLGGPGWLPVTPAELLVLCALISIMVSTGEKLKRPLELGPLFLAVAVYTVTVILGVILGLASNGDLHVAFFEARAQLFLFLAYLMAFNLIQTPSDIKAVMWVFLIAVGIKGLMGSWRFLFTLRGHLDQVIVVSNSNSLMAHEESIFFALFIVFLVLLFLFRSEPRQRKFCLLLALPVLLAFVANDRRAGVLALFIALLVAGIVTFAVARYRRKLLIWTAVAAAVLVPLYVAGLGHSSNLFAQPAKAFTSLYNPDPRDASSDRYRQLETLNLKYNIAEDPFFGQGYGMPMKPFVPLPSLTTCSLCTTVPHNTILWVWLRVGFLGFVAFWFMAGRSVVGAAMAAKSTRDRYLQAIAIFVMAAVVAWLIEGAVDQGLQDYRETILVGIFLAIVSRIAVLSARPPQSQLPTS